MARYCFICCVVNIGDADKVLEAAQRYGASDGFISIGKGTAHSRILEFFKLNEIRKEIVTVLVKGERAAEAIRGISEEMAFDKPHHGIAFSYAVDECIDGSEGTGENTTVSEVQTSMYKAIYVVVDRGRAEEVIEAANKAGARGGTIVNARGSGVHEAQKLFSIEISPEKEKVFIIAKNEMKDNIVSSIRTHLEIDTPGNGIIAVVDINEVYGLHQG